MVGLAPCTQKAGDTKGSLQVQLCSPSGSVDEYLAGPVEVDSANSSDPTDSCSNQVDNAPEALQSECIRSKETPVKVDDDSDKITKYMEIGNDINLLGSSLKPASGEQNVLHVETQSAEGRQEGSRNNNTQVIPGKSQTGEHAGVLSHELVENKTPDLEEAGQHQRGTRRRCLQFEASTARKISSASNCVFSKPASISRCSRVPANPTDLEMLESSQLNLAISSNNCTVNSSQPIASKSSLCSAKARETHVDKSVRNGVNCSIKAPLPSGIGLHLNSIVNTAAMGCTGSLSIKPTENDYTSAQTEKSPSVIELHLSENKSSSFPAILVGKFSAKNYGDHQETHSIVAENSSTSHFSYDNADKFQEFNQLSPQNKRKRTCTIEDDEGCRRCNCRRSKCLKLYCECFAAGIYCAEPCACQECFNKPEYEDMVFATRKQIESRNPLAFAPKIVRRVTDSPANSVEDNNKVTPSSARHKRGCNCKKSMCLKKYCECFQSGVGCSTGCRCEGCKNSFGIKEGYGEISGIASRKVNEESWEDLSDGNLVMETRSNFIHSEHRHPHNLTPLTPSFQSSNHGKDVPKARLPGRRCLPSPESDTNVLSSYARSPSSPRNLNTHDRRARIGEGKLDIVFDQELEFSATGRIGQFSPRWDGFEDISDLTPLRQAPAKSTSISSPSNSRECGNVSRVQLQGSVRFSGSLRWRSSPITPMPRLGGSKLRQEPDSDIGYDILEDDTPDILKDTHTPIKTVKASSPNQKRVSPPHNHLHSLTPSSSPGLRSGRKFVLQSISSFPSLTPYSDPKDSTSSK